MAVEDTHILGYANKEHYQGVVMTNKSIGRTFELMDYSTEELTAVFSINKDEPNESIYPSHDIDLDTEFDAIRSYN